MLSTCKACADPHPSFFQVISTLTEGGVAYSYSPRFTLTGMTGTTEPNYASVVTKLDGADAGPAYEGPSDATATGTAAADGPFAVPYQSQTGLTKYAPMQSVPPTKITASSYTPLYPTSSYSVAMTWLPPASILTTVTASQTFSVSSVENTVCSLAWPCLFFAFESANLDLWPGIRNRGSKWRYGQVFGEVEGLDQYVFRLADGYVFSSGRLGQMSGSLASMTGVIGASSGVWTVQQLGRRTRRW